MIGDGNGWSAAPGGATVWGRFGAAGLFLVAQRPTGGEEPEVLLQHRAPWTASGGTWALPGGARDSHETPVDAALREAVEETALDPTLVEVLDTQVTAGPFAADPERPELCGDWSYTCVLARTTGGDRLPVIHNEEALELAWIPLSELETVNLLPAFAAAVPSLRELALGLLR